MPFVLFIQISSLVLISWHLLCLGAPLLPICSSPVVVHILSLKLLRKSPGIVGRSTAVRVVLCPHPKLPVRLARLSPAARAVPSNLDRKHTLDSLISQSLLSQSVLLRVTAPLTFRNPRCASAPPSAANARSGENQPTGRGMLGRPRSSSTVHDLLNVAKEILNGITPPSAAETRRLQRAMRALVGCVAPLCYMPAVLLSWTPCVPRLHLADNNRLACRAVAIPLEELGIRLQARMSVH